MKLSKNVISNLRQILSCVLLMFIFGSCLGQQNPMYIGTKYGTLDLGEITFTENLDTLFSKQKKFFKLPKSDEGSGNGDPLYTIYRLPIKTAIGGTFKFNGFPIKPNEVVDFYADQSGRFRKVEVSVYMDEKAYNELRSFHKDFKDVTIAEINKVNNGKYTILQGRNLNEQIQTTLYCLNNKADSEGDPKKTYFVRISKISLKNAGDRFYQRFNDDIK